MKLSGKIDLLNSISIHLHFQTDIQRHVLRKKQELLVLEKINACHINIK